ncbi:MAG: hypothetical protein RID07_05560 [Lacipirellulaceae bacterium]
MTSCHNDETLSDVAFFAKNCTNFDQHEFHNFLVLIIGDDEQLEQEVEAALVSEFATK